MTTSSERAAEQIVWQRRLQPTMVTMVVGLTIFFFLASLFQLYQIHGRINSGPKLEMAASLETLSRTSETFDANNRMDAERWKTLVLLEVHALQQRYHQANVLLMARIWVRYLGFVTGMILALVGAIFILGKLRIAPASLSAEGGGIKGNISTTSPGLMLALLGTLLMIVTITTHNAIEVKDGPQYTSLPFLIDTRTTLGKPEDPAGLDAAGGGAAGKDASDRDNPVQKKPASNGRAPEVDDLTDAMLERLQTPPSTEGRQ